EYACHVRDVLDVQDGRIRLTQVEDVPAFEPMGREERVAGYCDVDPHGLPGQIRENADRLIRTLEGLEPGGWERSGIYSSAGPGERTVAWSVTHAFHEAVHHRRDLAAVGRSGVPGWSVLFAGDSLRQFEVVHLGTTLHAQLLGPLV